MQTNAQAQTLTEDIADRRRCAQTPNRTHARNNQRSNSQSTHARTLTLSLSHAFAPRCFSAGFCTEEEIYNTVTLAIAMRTVGVHLLSPGCTLLRAPCSSHAVRWLRRKGPVVPQGTSEAPYLKPRPRSITAAAGRHGGGVQPPPH